MLPLPQVTKTAQIVSTTEYSVSNLNIEKVLQPTSLHRSLSLSKTLTIDEPNKIQGFNSKFIFYILVYNLDNIEKTRIGNQLIQRVIRLQTELQKRDTEIEHLRSNLTANELNVKENIEKVLKDYLNKYQEAISKTQLENNLLKS